MSQNKSDDLLKTNEKSAQRKAGVSPARFPFVPSPFMTRRNRTISASKSADEGPQYEGVCVSFSQSAGHGFIQPEGEQEKIFLHVSDVDGDYVPIPGDKITYKLAPIPPKMQKFQAVQAQIVNLDPSKHHQWNSRRDQSPA